METDPQISVVVPFLDEEGSLEELHSRLSRVLESVGRSYEILFIDDGSRDGSSEEIDRLAAEHVEVRGIHFETNCGQTAAFDAGFKNARGAVVVTIDADLQNDPRDIPALLEALEGHAAAIGFRCVSRSSSTRR